MSTNNQQVNPPQVDPVTTTALIDSAKEVLEGYLKALGAPPHVVELVGNTIVLATYQEKILSNPAAQWIGIEELTISTINQIVQAGGSINVQSAVMPFGLLKTQTADNVA
jgi:hypothetical protein